MILSKLGKYEEALECYNEAINIDPTNVSAYTEKSWILSRLERYEMALECSDKDLELSNYQYDYVWVGKGFILSKLGNCTTLPLDPLRNISINEK